MHAYVCLDKRKNLVAEAHFQCCISTGGTERIVCVLQTALRIKACMPMDVAQT